MRVALVHGRADPALDGVADYTARLAGALREQSLDVVDVAVDPGPRGALAAARAVRRARPDVVHVQFAPSAFGFSAAPGLLPDLLGGVPLVTTVHEYGWWTWARRVPDAVWRRVERRRVLDRETGRLVPASAAVLTTNDAHDAALHARLGTAATRAPLLPNVDVDPAAPPRAVVRRTLGVPSDAELVVFFGFVHPVKGLRYLVDAVAALAVEHPRLHLLVVGGFTSLALPADEAAAFRAELTEHVERSGAAARVTITGHLPAAEVSAALQAADVAALPFTAGVTRKSGSLLAVLAHGLPTLVTDAGDPGLVDAATVITVGRVRDAGALVDGLRRLLDEPGLAARVAAGGRELVAGHSWAALAATHAEVYRTVVDGAAR